MKIFVQGFAYLCGLYLLIYAITNWGHNFSISLFLAQLLGILMLASLVFLCSKMSILGLTLFYVLLIISTLCFVIDLICFVIFDTPLTSVMIFTALETNLGETLSFASMYASKIVIALGSFALLLLGLFLYARWIASRLKIPSKILAVFALSGIPILTYQAYLLINRTDCRFNRIVSFVLPFRYGCELYGAFEEMSNAKKAFLNDQIAISKNNISPPPPAL